MGKLLFNITMTLDGYVAGPNPTINDPLGQGGEAIHDWVVKLKSWQESHGMSGDGETGPSDDVVRETVANLGATIMGRNMFGGGPGPWGAEPWQGWWGDNPPFHTPVFVLTHHPRSPLVMQGGTTFYFVTDGIESALRQAQKAAGDRDVMIAGGAATAQQFLSAGLIDEMEIHLVPQLLGGGSRLFEDLGQSVPRIDLVRTIPTADVTHLKYRIHK